MKKFIKLSSILMLLIYMFAFITVNATNIAMYSDNINVNRNRIFEVNIRVDSSTKLSAATFEIAYDTNYVEFRGTEAKVDNVTVKSKDNLGTVKAVFLSTDGVELNADTVLFVFQFKTIEYGEADFNIKMYDCVDSNAKELSSQSSTSCTAYIESTAKDDSDTSNADDKSSVNNTQEATDTKIDSQDNGLKKFSSIVDSVGGQQVMIGTIVAVSLAVIILVLFFISNKRDNKKEKDENGKGLS